MRSHIVDVVVTATRRFRWVDSNGAFSFGGVRSCGEWEVELEVVFSHVQRRTATGRIYLFCLLSDNNKGQCWIASQT